MDVLPSELWEIVVHHCVLWNEDNPDMDALLLLHRTNKHLGFTATRLLHDISNALSENDEDSWCEWHTEHIERPIMDALDTRVKIMFKREYEINRNLNRQE